MEYADIRDFLEAKGETTSLDASEYLGKVVRRLLGAIIMATNAVATAPHLSSDGICRRFNDHVAKGVVLDEAGCMT
jgi:hypothetical protein